jgi:hypothetical protein
MRAGAGGHVIRGLTPRRRALCLGDQERAVGIALGLQWLAMSGSEGPRPGLDRGVAALRWLLVSAQDDDSARAHVLPALSRCTVLVPTMQGAPDKLRLLTQSGGNAMVVFTGHDALEHAAKKLGWAQGTQSVSFRAMSARDALELASLQGTRSIIVDAAAEHALELRYDEVSMYLSRGTGEFAPDFIEPSSRGTGEYGLPSRRTSPIPAARKTNAPPGGSRGTGEFSPRGTGERNVADVREEVAPRAGRDARRDDVGGGMAARVERMMAAEAAAASEREPAREIRTHGARGRDQPTQPMAAPEPAAPEAPPRKRNLAEMDDPFNSSAPRRAVAPQPPQPVGGQVRRIPSLAAPPLSRDMPSSPFETSRPPSQPREDETPIVPLTAHAVATRRAREETIPLDDISSAHAARISAERAGLGSLPVAAFERADASPMERAVAAAQVRPVREPEPSARGTGTMPKPAREEQATPSVAPAEPIADDEVTVTAAVPMQAELNESVLGALAEELRRFPEVEWACELPDGDEPIISIRVDPSYLARTEDIEDAVRMTARRSGGEVKPVIVSTPDATKDARTRGRMFYPWKKKK